MRLLLLEPDRVVAKCIVDAMPEFVVDIAQSASDALVLADNNPPDVVVCELTLPGHSGSEFLYEFRSYEDWQEIPVYIYTLLTLDSDITASDDWQRLAIAGLLSKSEVDIVQLKEAIQLRLGSEKSDEAD